jgi:dTDP-3-amino-3,4,6-trideoxy-alpha-D-glucose transaminase
LGRRRLTIPFLDLSRQIAATRPDIDAAIERTLRRGRLVLGEALEAFERDFAAYCGARHAVGVGSGTDAIALALEAVGTRPGDEVITAANTCMPTVDGIRQAGCVPVLGDVDPDTYTLSPLALEGALSARTCAIVPVHLYGQCAETDPILQFARAHGLKVVEDAAQAHGAEYRGRRAGTLGDAAAFSFYPTKNLGALGEAGAVVTNDPAVADMVRMARNHGEKKRYNSIVPGRNSRLDELQAAILVAKLPHLDAWNERRRALAAGYARALDESPLTLPREGLERRHIYHLFVVRTPHRDALRRSLAERGVETLIHYPRPVHHHPAYERLGPERSLVTSERLCEEVVSLPLYPELTDAEFEAITARVVDAAATVVPRIST